MSPWQVTAFRELIYMINDLPYFFLVLLIALCPWRFSSLKPILFSDMDEWERKKKILALGVLVMMDFPAVLCVGILLLSWRHQSFRKRLAQVFVLIFLPFSQNPSQGKTQLIFQEFWEFLIDLPFLFLGIFCLWRSPFLLKKALNQGWKFLGNF
jgi:hypothetical protein